MLLNVFDVDHGACALISTSNGRQVLIDCGHHAHNRWYPGTALSAMGISVVDKLYVTNFDEDHVSGFGNLMRNVDVDVLATNATVGPRELASMKSEHGMGHGIALLHNAMLNTFTGGPPLGVQAYDFGDTSFTVYWNQFSPRFGFTDTNNLSLAIFVKCGPHKVLFPGDLERPGWKALMRDPSFIAELFDVNLFVASHHGRANGYCEELMALCPNIQAVIISDEGKVFQTQETTDLYRRHSKGFQYNGQQRKVLTTRSDGTMRFHLNQMGGGSVLLNIAA
ncbi:MAG: hypothetical protein AAF667_13090 [Pseudomonadota bacterium]